MFGCTEDRLQFFQEISRIGKFQICKSPFILTTVTFDSVETVLEKCFKCANFQVRFSLGKGSQQMVVYDVDLEKLKPGTADSL